MVHRQKSKLYFKSAQAVGSLALLGATKAKMSADNVDLSDLLQNADQLFDENQYQEVIDILKKHPVSTFTAPNDCVHSGKNAIFLSAIEWINPELLFIHDRNVGL